MTQLLGELTQQTDSTQLLQHTLYIVQNHETDVMHTVIQQRNM